LSNAIDHLNTALDQTRTHRVLQILDHPTQLHLEVLGPVPARPAGCAVWCHHASRLEHHLDHGIDSATWRCVVTDLGDTHALARLADRHIGLADLAASPSQWAQVTDRALELHASTIEHARRLPSVGLSIDLEL
jgi:hypothetical protein